MTLSEQRLILAALRREFYRLATDPTVDLGRLEAEIIAREYALTEQVKAGT